MLINRLKVLASFKYWFRYSPIIKFELDLIIAIDDKNTIFSFSCENKIVLPTVPSLDNNTSPRRALHPLLTSLLKSSSLILAEPSKPNSYFPILATVQIL